jgi:hypothetical protein
MRLVIKVIWVDFVLFTFTLHCSIQVSVRNDYIQFVFHMYVTHQILAVCSLLSCSKELTVK